MGDRKIKEVCVYFNKADDIEFDYCEFESPLSCKFEGGFVIVEAANGVVIAYPAHKVDLVEVHYVQYRFTRVDPK